MAAVRALFAFPMKQHPVPCSEAPIWEIWESEEGHRILNKDFEQDFGSVCRERGNQVTSACPWKQNWGLHSVDNFIVISYFTVCEYSLGMLRNKVLFSFQVLCVYISAGWSYSATHQLLGKKTKPLYFVTVQQGNPGRNTVRNEKWESPAHSNAKFWCHFALSAQGDLKSPHNAAAQSVFQMPKLFSFVQSSWRVAWNYALPGTRQVLGENLMAKQSPTPAPVSETPQEFIPGELYFVLLSWACSEAHNHLKCPAGASQLRLWPLFTNKPPPVFLGLALCLSVSKAGTRCSRWQFLRAKLNVWGLQIL